MSEREVSEQEIDDKLTEIMESDYENKSIQFLAKILFNVRFDLNELKLKLVEAFKNSGSIDPEEIYLAYPDEMEKKIKRFIYDIYS